MYNSVNCIPNITQIKYVISAITPVYNGERFIASCIKVIIDQNCPNVEHIIVDGGSTDGTVDIIKQYAQKYPHIRWISEKDRGQSDAMNKGIAMAQGEIIGMLNVDDFYEPNVLNPVLKIFQSLPEHSFIVGNCNIWDDEENLIGVNKPAKMSLSELLLGPQLNPFPMNPSAYFYHTSLHQKIGLYKLDEHYTMDLDFILKAVQVASVKYFNETWGNFRLIEGTKTFKDLKTGEVYERINSILNHFRKELPMRQQVKIYIEKYLKELMLKTRSYMTKLPKLPQIIKSKLVKNSLFSRSLASWRLKFLQLK